jgi:sugar phosphate isomerase/epimerase
MKIGLKTFDNEKFLDYFADKVDFFEIMAMEGKSYEFMKKYRVPIVIHAQHNAFGINNTDKTLQIKNEQSINFAKQIAALIKSKKIILHPGEIRNVNCSLENSIRFIQKINDPSIHLENMPHWHKEVKCLVTTPEEMKEFKDKTNVKFCFDINHAIEAAVQLKKEPLQFIKNFLKLNPNHYHLGGQNLKKGLTHLDFESSDINLDEIFKILPKEAEITLEVTQDIEKTEKDLEIIKRLVKKYEH